MIPGLLIILLAFSIAFNCLFIVVIKDSYTEEEEHGREKNVRTDHH